MKNNAVVILPFFTILTSCSEKNSPASSTQESPLHSSLIAPRITVCIDRIGDYSKLNIYARRNGPESVDDSGEQLFGSEWHNLEGELGGKKQVFKIIPSSVALSEDPVLIATHTVKSNDPPSEIKNLKVYLNSGSSVTSYSLKIQP